MQQGALSKDEVEKLLRHGAYDIFSEDKAGEGEAESNAFAQQDIDSILQRRSHIVVHENTGSKSNASGGTFSKASFKPKIHDPDNKRNDDDIDIEDPDFWKKMIGEGSVGDDDEIAAGRRPRAQKNYSENDYQRRLEKSLTMDNEVEISGESSGDSDADDYAPNGDSQERLQWGGSLASEWRKDDVESLVKSLCTFGYGRMPWELFAQRSALTKEYNISEVRAP